MYRLPSPLSHSLVDETLSSSSQRLKVENTISTSSSSAARVSLSQFVSSGLAMRVVLAITPHPPRQRRLATPLPRHAPSGHAARRHAVRPLGGRPASRRR